MVHVFYINIQDRLKALNINKDFLSNNKLKIKLSADGTNLTTTLKICNITFSIISEKSNFNAASGHYIIGIFQIEKENYEILDECLKEIFIQIEQLNHIECDNEVYETDKKSFVFQIFFSHGNCLESNIVQQESV